MSSNVNDYPPGTVAVATVPDYEAPYEKRKARVSRYSDGWALLTDPDVFWPDHRNDVTDVRPLVVLDIDDPDLSGNAEARRQNLLDHLRRGTAISRHLADQIEAQMKPPRIPEPGLWGVVEATVAFEGTTYQTAYQAVLVRHPGSDSAKCWLDQSGSWFAWDDLIDPVLIREGVES